MSCRLEYTELVIYRISRIGFSLKESRLCCYEWNTERTFKETRNYAQGIDNPVDAVLHAGAAAVHVLTGVGDAVLGDIVRVVQGKNNRVPLAPYQGSLPRLKLDASEAVHAVGNVVHGKVTSLLALPIIALKATGDAVADGADLLAGVKHGSSYTLAA